MKRMARALRRFACLTGLCIGRANAVDQRAPVEASGEGGIEQLDLRRRECRTFRVQLANLRRRQGGRAGTVEHLLGELALIGLGDLAEYLVSDCVISRRPER